MFNIGGGELLVIFLVALVVLGPNKLPEAARQVGKMMGEFRKLSAGFQQEVRQAMNDPVGDALKRAEADVERDKGEDVPAIAPVASGIETLDTVELDDKLIAAQPKRPTTAADNDTASADPVAETGDADEGSTSDSETPEEHAEDQVAEDPPMFGDR